MGVRCSTSARVVLVGVYAWPQDHDQLPHKRRIGHVDELVRQHSLGRPRMRPPRARTTRRPAQSRRRCGRGFGVNSPGADVGGVQFLHRSCRSALADDVISSTRGGAQDGRPLASACSRGADVAIARIPVSNVHTPSTPIGRTEVARWEYSEYPIARMPVSTSAAGSGRAATTKRESGREG
jgi:hypothetical protein